MRFVYLDEAGIGSLKDEPSVVVAGVITEPDRDFRKIEAYLAQLAERYVPEDKKQSFVVFHAKELFGGGKTFPRDKYSTPDLMPIIKRLLRAPFKFQIPVVYGICDRLRPWLGDHQHLSTKEATKKAYQQAFLLTLMRVNAWRRKHARPEELALVIVEDNDTMHEALKNVQLWGQYPAKMDPAFARFMPLERIVETILFSKKDESMILQISDMCAHVISRFANNKPYSGDLFATLRPMVQWVPRNERDTLRDATTRHHKRTAVRALKASVPTSVPIARFDIHPSEPDI